MAIYFPSTGRIPAQNYAPLRRSINMLAQPAWYGRFQFFGGGSMYVGQGTVALGPGTLENCTSPILYNVAVGYECLQANTTGENNVAIGYKAMEANTTGSYNVGMGYKCLTTNTTGAGNVAIGNEAMLSNDTGNYNVAIGVECMESNTSGSTNVAMGYQCLKANTTGTQNVAVGYQAGILNTTGSYNVALGYKALTTNTEGSNNVAVGTECLRLNTTGGDNVAMGTYALQRNTTGQYNVGAGNQALQFNTTGMYNIGVGYQALLNNDDGIFNVALGHCTLSTSTSANSNVAIGAFVMTNTTSGASNTGVGTNALWTLTTGNYNTAVGGSSLVVHESGNYNTAIGYSALALNEDGSYNVAVGRSAGATNVNGSYNVFLGHQAGGAELGSQRLYIANTNTATPLIYGEFDTPLVRINGALNVTGAQTFDSSITIGSGTAATDYTITFNGETNDGVLTWMEDEDYFQFSDDVLIPAGEHLCFRDTAIHLASLDDGHLDLTADIQIDLNGPVLATDKILLTQDDGNEYIDSLADGFLDLCATTAVRFNNAAADTDVVVQFIGTTSSGQLTWMEDEDYFQWADDLLLPAGERWYFRDTNHYVSSEAAGYLDFCAASGVRLTAVSGAATVENVAYEDITITAGNSTADSVGNLLPAGATILDVSYRLKTDGGAIATVDVGTAANPDLYVDDGACANAGDTGQFTTDGGDATYTGPHNNATAQVVRVTTDVNTTGDSVITVAVHYLKHSPPTA
jgi:hypothetical protein